MLTASSSFTTDRILSPSNEECNNVITLSSFSSFSILQIDTSDIGLGEKERGDKGDDDDRNNRVGDGDDDRDDDRDDDDDDDRNGEVHMGTADMLHAPMGE